MKKTIVHGKNMLNWDESTPEERQQFYENMVISKKQARQIAFALCGSETFWEYIEEHQAEWNEKSEKS